MIYVVGWNLVEYTAFLLNKHLFSRINIHKTSYKVVTASISMRK